MERPALYCVATNPVMEADVANTQDMDLVLLRSLLAYDAATGVVKWSKDHLTYKTGDDAGYVRKDGTRVIWFGDKERSAAPIVWALHNGEYPNGRVRFKGEKGDLRIENLYVPAGNWQHRANRNAYDRGRREADPQLFRGDDLKKNFGITIERYAEMLKAQSGVCAICAQPETAIRNGKLKMLAVDHCHAGSGIRGLLCQDCNLGIGRFADDPDRLRAAAAYLERHTMKKKAVA